MSGPESKFQHKITAIFDKWIKQGKPIYYFVKEAASIRGIPDLVICANGDFVVWEVKSSEEEAEKTSGRIVLQKYTLKRVQGANGEGAIIHPGNVQLALKLLESKLG